MAEPLRIMVLDDDVAYANSIKELLTTPERSVHTCFKPTDALEMLRKVKPHCLILDLRMPLFNGRDMLSWAHRECPHMAIIICSGDTVTDEKFFKAYGVKKILRKPVGTSELIRTIDEALGSQDPAAP